MATPQDSYTTVILGAGAAGMMCAAHAGPGVLVLDHAANPGEKIRISGGGRCNFTNMYAGPENFISANPHFAKSALSRYTQWDFIDLVARHGIPYHEKTLGQLFCDTSSKDIIRLLRDEMDRAGAALWLRTTLDEVTHDGARFRLRVTREGQSREVTAQHLVVACGGKSIPKIGASDQGYRLARQFGHALTETRPALVPLTFGAEAAFADLAGVASPARIAANGTSFDEALLFTHRGLSGPAILQVSSYWREGDGITVQLCPEVPFFEELRTRRSTSGRRDLATVLTEWLPKRLAQSIAARVAPELAGRGNLADLSDAHLRAVTDALTEWHLKPTGTEGYRKAEVTLGGVETDGLSSRSLESRTQPGLYFIGEVVDVTGWLGGYNFQWAWSSGWAAGQDIAAKTRAG
ncbi:NAD(P)/FAD-dependent oxidoreductase [Dinoroseobacter sp. S124A]|uniref:NAD(P)/FAD-dependent oxidoreductase n=1 Tax=Dinoroseobacter sp. S124A TaxID=3415128 RepID=UPI003C7DF25D